MAAVTQSASEEPNVLRAIWKHRVLVGVIAAFFALVGMAVYMSRPITYAAHAGVLLQNPRSTIDSKGNGSKGDATRYVADQIAVMKSGGVLARASERMRTFKGLTPLTPGELQRAMTITADQGSSWVTVRVSADDPVTAKFAANSEIYAYRVATKSHVTGQTRAALRKLDHSIAAVAKQMAKPTRTAAQQATALALIRQLHGRRNRIEVDGELTGDGVALFSAAGKGKLQGAPLLASMLIGLVLGGLIGCGISYLIEAVKMRRLGQHGPPAHTASFDGVNRNPIPAEQASASTIQHGTRWTPAEQGPEPMVQHGRRWR